MDTHCTTPPTPLASSNLKLINWDGQPVAITAKLTYKCKDGMKFQDDEFGDSVQVECQSGNSFDIPSAWPSCIPTPTCPTLEPLPETPWNGTTTLNSTATWLTEGYGYGPCLGIKSAYDSAPSCPYASVYIPATFAGTGFERFAKPIFNITPDVDLTELHLRVTFSAPVTVLQDKGTAPTDGAQDREKVFHFSMAFTSGNSETFQPVLSYTEDINLEFCVYDISCAAQDIYLDQNSTEVGTFAPNDTNNVYKYGAEVMYECGRARAFDNNPSYPLTQNFTCAWDGTWTPQPALMDCVWTHCDEPAAPPANLNVIYKEWDGEPIPFTTKFPYQCHHRMKFVHDFNVTELNATCNDGNIWSPPPDPVKWGNCTESKFL